MEDVLQQCYHGSIKQEEARDMNFARNLQYLRKMHHSMTQEDLAERIGVSRQTISKWETGDAFPEMDKTVELCRIFSCSMDQLIREDMNVFNEAYSDIRVQKADAFRYVRYSVVSACPEEDALQHIRSWTIANGIQNPQIIGWDFPHVSQEQVNVFRMHGYTAACVLPEGFTADGCGLEVMTQSAGSYAAITIKNPFKAPFTLIPNAYKALMSFMQINGHRHEKDPETILCYEKVYEREGAEYLDVFIAIEK